MIGVAISHMLFLHLYSRHSPGATPAESCVSLSMQYLQVSGWTRWNFVQISCQPTPTSTRPFRSMMLMGIAGQPVEIIHQRLDRPGVDDVGQLPVAVYGGGWLSIPLAFG